MKSSLVSFQLGKSGLTEGFINALETTFKNHELVKIAVLKRACRDRNELKEKINKTFTARTVGFTIFVRKWRKIM